jgi:hypothetical protein
MLKCKDSELGKLLFAYELNGLSEEATERFETHLLECEYCFNELKSFEREADLLSSDDDVKRLINDAARPDHTRQDSVMSKVWKFLWPETPIVFRPALGYIVILLLIIPAYWGFQRPPDDNIMPIHSINLLPGRSADENQFSLSSGNNGLLSFVVRGSIPGKKYRVEILSDDGTVLFVDDNYNHFDNYETGRILLPLTGMHPGIYRLVIIDSSEEPPLNRHERSFIVVK